MKRKVIKAISEVHSGNRDEATKIANIVIELYEPILQAAARNEEYYKDYIKTLGDLSDTCVRIATGVICDNCRCGRAG